jgi:hypothetical protein
MNIVAHMDIVAPVNIGAHMDIVAVVVVLDILPFHFVVHCLNQDSYDIVI